jgi:F0F1-type ATP synthase alpha subunit
VRQWEAEFLNFIHTSKQSLFDELDQAKDLTSESIAQIEAAIKEFNSTFKGAAAAAAVTAA